MADITVTPTLSIRIATWAEHRPAPGSVNPGLAAKQAAARRRRSERATTGDRTSERRIVGRDRPRIPLPLAQRLAVVQQRFDDTARTLGFVSIAIACDQLVVRLDRAVGGP
jgi:hypothetical protein